jgi:membrane protein
MENKSIYILISGRVVIQIADPQTSSVVHQEVLSPVTFFGEMSYLLEEERSATVVADGDVVLLELSPEFFERLLAHTPNVSRLIIRKLSERVKLTNSDLVEKTLLAGG